MFWNQEIKENLTLTFPGRDLDLKFRPICYREGSTISFPESLNISRIRLQHEAIRLPEQPTGCVPHREETQRVPRLRHRHSSGRKFRNPRSSSEDAEVVLIARGYVDADPEVL